MKLSPKQREALNLVADGKFVPRLVKEEDGWHARWRALGVEDEGVDGWVDEYVRESTMTRLSEDAEDQKHETLHDAWMLALRSRTGLVVWDDAECAAFAAELEVWGGNAEEDVEARRKITFSFRTDTARIVPSVSYNSVWFPGCVKTPRAVSGSRTIPGKLSRNRRYNSSVRSIIVPSFYFARQSGSVTTKVLPNPGALSSGIVPSSSVMMRSTRESPSPLPFPAWEVSP